MAGSTGRPKLDTDEDHSDVIRLLRLAQTGDREQALVQADEQLRAAESLGMLYARAVALHCMGDFEGAARTADRMLTITAGVPIPGTTAARAERDGWRSIALSYRALKRMILNELDTQADRQAFDLESILLDLAQAEALLSDNVPDGFLLATSHSSLGGAYNELRLYELAAPHFEIAFAAATARTNVIVERAVASQINLATMHLNWSMELLRVADTAGAAEKSAIAAGHAGLAQELSITDDSQPYAAHVGLLLACAQSSRGDDRMAVTRIRAALDALEAGGARESRAFALPFLARALDRVGQHAEALEVAQQAISALPDNAMWVTAAPAYHTHATLLARSGSDSAVAALAYGDQLAETLWRQRLRTLQNVRSMQVLERVTLERDRVQVLAYTDALTGVGNRRAFDVRMAELGSAADSVDVTLIAVDVDRLKEVNDARGHEAGDRTLKAVAGALFTQVRSGDLVARLGGDEFVAVLEGMSRAAAMEVVDRMVDAVSVVLGSRITVSVGVATGPASETGASLLRAADRAMYAAKRNKRVVGPGSQAAVEAMPEHRRGPRVAG